MFTRVTNLQNAEKKLTLKQQIIWLLQEKIVFGKQQVVVAESAKQELEETLQVTEERLRMAENRIKELESHLHSLGLNVAKMDTLPQDWVKKALSVLSITVSKKKCKASDATNFLDTQMQNIANELLSAEIEEFVEF